jgi:hypothetical protein
VVEWNKIFIGRKKLMSLDKNELELLSAGYLAAAQNDQEELRKIVNKMARKFDHWIVILQTGARLSLVSVDLGSEKLQSEPVKWMIGYIGWQGHKTTYSRLNMALVTLRGNSTEINRLKGANTKGEVMAAMLTITGQVIFRKHDDSPELYENAAKEAAANALETTKYISEDEKTTKRALAANAMKKRRDRRSSGGGFWDGVKGFFELAFDIVDIFT